MPHSSIMSESDSHFFIQISSEFSGIRVDQALSRILSDHTRANIQNWIKQGLVLIDSKPIKQKLKLTGDETIEVTIPVAQEIDFTAQSIQLDILHEDPHLMVINKPAGLVVHPGAGNQDGTLLNGLLFHCPRLAKLPRAGIVHRLDKNTSGLMVIAKTEPARQHLIAQLQSREMKRQYVAVVEGIMISGETIDQPIGRHRQDRLRMAVTQSGKTAITHIRVLQKFRKHCLLQASLETGRTHQIRVHLSWKGYSIVGDKLYGNRNKVPPESSAPLTECIQNFNRQALHAKSLSLIHPQTSEPKTWDCAPPEDINKLISLLSQDAIEFSQRN